MFTDLFVRASNKLGNSVYTKLGYIIYRRVLSYYSGGDDGEDAFGESNYFISKLWVQASSGILLSIGRRVGLYT